MCVCELFLNFCLINFCRANVVSHCRRPELLGANANYSHALMTFLQLKPLFIACIFTFPRALLTSRTVRASSRVHPPLSSLSLSAGFLSFPYDMAQHVGLRYRVHYITLYRYKRHRVYIATERRLLYEDNR